ncbi:MAG: zinc-ribbon domain-containing protein [Spirochaetaceae bacterium]|nr:zinc-ribbon domain-containing protein [Spirochaetaceae bacterium]
MFCSSCGTKLEEGTKFCPKCGSAVSMEGKTVPVGEFVKKTSNSVSEKSSNFLRSLKENVVDVKGKICLLIFLAVMIVFSILCGNFGETTAIQRAKILTFLENVYDRGYSLGQVVNRTLKNVEWSAKEIDDDLYVVTVEGKLSDEITDSKLHRLVGAAAVEEVIWSFNFNISYDGSFLFGGDVFGSFTGAGASYLGEYQEASSYERSIILDALYASYDEIAYDWSDFRLTLDYLISTMAL